MRTADGNALLWWKVDPDGIKSSEVGIIDSPAGTTYASPSLAVNRMGGMLISFCTLSKWTYPSASFVYRDSEGGVSNPAVIRVGDTPVQSWEWGKYTTVVEDPNGRDFWVGQIYAISLRNINAALKLDPQFQRLYDLEGGTSDE